MRTLQIYMKTSLIDNINTTKMIRNFLQQSLEKPQLPYTPLLKWTHGYTQFHHDEPVYRSANITGLCNTSKQQTFSDHIIYFSNYALYRRSKQLVKRSCKYILISDLEILIHYCSHECIKILDISIEYSPNHTNILQTEVFIQFSFTCTPLHYDLLLLI